VAAGRLKAADALLGRLLAGPAPARIALELRPWHCILLVYEVALMIRKQIYLPAQEDRRLKEIARAQGRSEAALIREAIRRRLDEEDARDASWQRLRALLASSPATGSASDRFDRREAYVDRTSRYDEAR
jgi:predicted DNA-binding protein